jgi:hypothetical protein
LYMEGKRDTPRPGVEAVPGAHRNRREIASSR